MDKQVSAYFLTGDPGEAPLWVNTKIKGMPYLPKGSSFPECMKLLFQINFDELPDLPSMPHTGIMQIFISDTMDLSRSGMYYSDQIAVRYYEKIDYTLTPDERYQADEYPCEAFVYSEFGGIDISDDSDNVFGQLQGCRYLGCGATMEVFGDGDHSCLGTEMDPGIIFGGSIYRENLSRRNYSLLEDHPDHTFPLLRINATELPGCGLSSIYFMVTPRSFSNKHFSDVLLLAEEREWEYY